MGLRIAGRGGCPRVHKAGRLPQMLAVLLPRLLSVAEWQLQFYGLTPRKRIPIVQIERQLYVCLDARIAASGLEAGREN